MKVSQPTQDPPLEPYDYASDFSEFLSRNEGTLMGFAWTKTWNQHDAEDLVSHAMQRLFEKRPTINSEKGLLAWLKTVMKNKFLDDLKKKRSFLSEPMPDEGLPCTESGPEGMAMERDLSSILKNLVERLPMLERNIILLRFFHGLNNSEIADVTSKTANHVGVIIHNAIGRLKVAAARIDINR